MSALWKNHSIQLKLICCQSWKGSLYMQTHFDSKISVWIAILNVEGEFSFVCEKIIDKKTWFLMNAFSFFRSQSDFHNWRLQSQETSNFFFLLRFPGQSSVRFFCVWATITLVGCVPTIVLNLKTHPLSKNRSYQKGKNKFWHKMTSPNGKTI